MMLVCTFDCEGSWGRPAIHGHYRLARTVRSILAVLARRRVRAVFFIVGQLVERHPELIAEIAAGGHEIGLHGWSHRGLDRLSDAKLDEEMRGVASVVDLVEKIGGTRPTGFRAPHLLAPRFWDARVYRWLEAIGFTWVSNREVRYPAELFHAVCLQGALPLACRQPRGVSAKLQGWSDRVDRTALKALNALSIAREIRLGAHGAPGGWWYAGVPFRRGALWEYPLLSPMDCDLLGLPAPDEPTPEHRLVLTRRALLRHSTNAHAGRMLTFHDWIIGTANRLELLESVLAAPPFDMGPWTLPGLGETRPVTADR